MSHDHDKTARSLAKYICQLLIFSHHPHSAFLEISGALQEYLSLSTLTQHEPPQSLGWPARRSATRQGSARAFILVPKSGWFNGLFFYHVHMAKRCRAGLMASPMPVPVQPAKAAPDSHRRPDGHLCIGMSGKPWKILAQWPETLDAST